ncbi:MAG: AprI/Inh family metalloprotease inhibitor [Rhizomicrobium sp.]
MTRKLPLMFAGVVLGIGLGSVSASAAQGLAGAWTYHVSGSTSCTVTLSSDADGGRGQITSAANCPGGLFTVTHWHLIGSNLELSGNAGSLVAVLQKSAHGFRGSLVDGGRKITLSRSVGVGKAS